MQAIKVILVVVCLAGVASAASWPRNSTCEECKAEIEKIKKDLPKFEEEQIEECKTHAKFMQPICVQEVKDYVDYLSKHTPEQVCQDDHSCPRETPLAQVDLQTTRIFAQDTQVNLPQDSTCEECKAEWEKVKKDLPKYEEEQIEACKKHAKFMQPICVKEVKELVKYLSKHTPEQVCQDEHSCPRELPSGGLNLPQKPLVGFSL